MAALAPAVLVVPIVVVIILVPTVLFVGPSLPLVVVGDPSALLVMAVVVALDVTHYYFYGRNEWTVCEWCQRTRTLSV